MKRKPFLIEKEEGGRVVVKFIGLIFSQNNPKAVILHYILEIY